MVDDVDWIAEEEPDRPEWDDEYFEDVATRLMFNYDLEKDRVVEGTSYDLYGILQVETRSHIFHPMLDYGNHYIYEHIFAKRRRSIRTPDLRRQVELGHDLGDRWIVPDEEHFSTDFTFVNIVPSIPPEVESFVEGYKDRNLIKFGYHGHYEINLVVVDPEGEHLVASKGSDSHRAFRTWADIENVPRKGLIGRIIDTLRA